MQMKMSQDTTREVTGPINDRDTCCKNERILILVDCWY